MSDKRFSLVMTGTVIAESGLATSPPGAQGADKVQRLPRMPVFYPGSEAADETVYFPGAGFKGKLRRAASASILEIERDRTGKEAPFSLHDHYYHRIGGVVKARAEDEKDMSVANIMASRDKNPHISLMGGGLFSSSRLSVSHLVPTAPVDGVLVRGVRQDDFRKADGLSLLSEAEIIELDKFQSMAAKKITAKADKKRLNKEIAKARKAGEPVEALEQELADLEEALTANPEAIMRPLEGYEMIPVGTLLSSRLTLRNISLAELSHFLRSFNLFAHDPVLGAKVTQGLGLISGSWKVTEPGKGEIGHLALVPYEGINIDGPWADYAGKAHKAWDDQLDEFDFTA